LGGLLVGWAAKTWGLQNAVVTTGLLCAAGAALFAVQARRTPPQS